jgi:hypothetical protein
VRTAWNGSHAGKVPSDGGYSHAPSPESCSV